MCTGCAHGLCTTGPALDPSCDSCVGEICMADPFCCSSNWDGICVNEVMTICGSSCATCGNGACDMGETCTTCPSDCGTCGPVCGDFACTPGEDCFTCPVDC